jgi:endonuclease YncB( thermonuclease family)
MPKKSFLLLLLFTFCSLFTNFRTEFKCITQYTFTAKVIGIKDGDTLEVLYNSKPLTIRLEHIDCPEKGQDFGKLAKQKLAELCFKKFATIKVKGEDRNGRLISEVFVNGSNINKQMVQSGLAWHFKKYSKNKEYALLENIAKQKKLGLWAHSKPIAPWVWRKTKHQKP